MSQPPLQVFGDNFAKNYTPSPHDSKYAVDLLNALQHHLPLSFWQKVFVIFTLFPGPFSWKLAIFNFFSRFSFAPVIAIVIGGLFLIAVTYLVKRFAFKRLVRKDRLTFLELAFPSANDKTPYATEQFFAFLYALAKQRKFSHRLLGHKKAYSLEIAATKEEGIRYILGIPSSESSIVEKSLLSYLPGIKMREIDDYLPEDLLDKKKKDQDSSKIGIIELKLSNDFVLPLKKHKTLDEHDPIAYLTGNMTKLGSDELMVFQAVVTPVTSSTHRSILKHLKTIEERIYTNRPLSEELFKNPGGSALSIPLTIIKGAIAAFSFCLNGILNIFVMVWDDANNINTRESSRAIVQAVNSRQEILNPYEQELQTEVKEKIDKQMFEVSLRLLVKSDSKTEYDLRTSGFLASHSSLSSPYQSLIEKKGLFSFLKPSLSTFTKREVSSNNNPILSISELTDIYHYAETTRTEDLVKSKNQPLPAPLSFKQTSTKFDNVFAKNSYGGTETPIGQTLEERRRHTYILGATGSGKTTLLANMIYEDICNGKGVGVIDPHGRLVEKLLQVIPEERIDDVVWFAPDDDGFPIALNLLELKDQSLSSSQLQKQKSLVASSIISIIKKFYEAKFFGPRMEYVLRNAILTALETPSPTLQTILDLLTKNDYRKQIAKGLNNQVLKDYWVNEFGKLGSLQKNTVVSPITNKIGGILSSPINYNILTQEKSKLDFDDVINSGKILLCDLSKGKIGEDESSFFGSLIIAKIQLAALNRALMAEDNQNDFFLYVDEFQNFATQTFAELVSEARKYHLATILAHQSISQIENRDIVKVILANVGTVICFKTANPEDEDFILPIFSPEVLKHEIANLPLYNFYMKVSVGQAQDTFLAQADNFTIEGDEAIAEAAIKQSRKHYAVPVETSIIDNKISKIDLRHSTRKVSHLIKSSETKNTRFSGSKPNNFSIYPIQEGSKVGNGSSVNKNKQNVSLKKLYITSQQQQILFLLFRFRFLDRTQIQQLLNHKNHKRILEWLNDLTIKKFIKPIDPKTLTNNSKAKIYYLAKNSIQFLAAQDGYDRPLLQKLYRENNRSITFINSCLLLADIYLDFQNRTNDKVRSTMQVKSDYYSYQFRDLLIDLSPSAYIEQNKSGKTKRYFIEILADLPTLRLRQRLKKYLNFYQSNEWEAKTGKSFPAILIVCPNDRVLAYVRHYLKTKLADLDEPELIIHLTTADKVKEFGITGDIWAALS